MRIYPRGKRGILWADFTVAGQRFTRSSGTTERQAAQEWAARAAADLWRQRRLGEKPRVTFGEAVFDWLKKHGDERRSIEDMRDRLRWLCERLASSPLLTLTAARVSAVLAQKQGAPGTLNRYVAEVSKILHHAHRQGWIDSVPAFRRYQEPKQAPRWLTREQAETLISELPAHLANMACFALATGLRESNVRLLRWSQVDLSRGVAWVLPTETKNGRALSVPLNADAIEVLLRQRGAHKVYVFIYEHIDGTRKPVRNCSSHAWYKALTRAKLDGFRWHDLRHTWASWHVQDGTRLDELMRLGGWSSYDLVLRYAHLNPGDLSTRASASLRDKSATTSGHGSRPISSDNSQDAGSTGETLGWLTGLEPATTGITRRSPPVSGGSKLLNLNDALARKRRKSA